MKMKYWNRIKIFFRMSIDIADLIARSTAFLIFIYIVYCKTQQQIIAVACLVIAVIGIRVINEYVLTVIDKFRRSIKGSIPGLGGDYEIKEYETREVETPIPLQEVERESILRLNRSEKFNEVFEIAARFIRSKEWSMAAKYMEEALQIIPIDTSLRTQLIVIYGEQIGDKKKAIYHCEEILKREPGDLSAMFNLAVYTNHLKGAEYSKPIYLEAEKIIKDKGLFDSEIYGKLNLFVGHDYLHIGQKEEAEKRYKEAISILKKQADKGDKTSIFWLEQAEDNLKKLKSVKEGNN